MKTYPKGANTQPLIRSDHIIFLVKNIALDQISPDKCVEIKELETALFVDITSLLMSTKSGSEEKFLSLN